MTFRRAAAGGTEGTEVRRFCTNVCFSEALLVHSLGALLHQTARKRTLGHPRGVLGARRLQRRLPSGPPRSVGRGSGGHQHFSGT